MDRLKLPQRRILITGAASGIGRATAQLFAAEGASLALLDRDVEGMAATSQACMATGNDIRVVSVSCDLTDRVAVPAAVQSLAQQLGGLDGVVNSAGIVQVSTLEALEPDEWQRTLDINLTAPYLVCRAALPLLRAAGGGTIVNLASASGLRPMPQSAAYASSKAGLIMFSKVLAAELARDQIRVNAVCPGPTETPMFHGGLGKSDDLDKVRKLYALRRFAQPIELANSILFLSCDDSSFITGVALAVDGGRAFH